MLWRWFIWTVFVGHSTLAAEIKIDFSTDQAGASPDGFVSLLAGEGRTGRWEVATTEVAPALAPLSPEAPHTAVKAVLTQADHDPTDERFPLFVYSGEQFGDFTVTTRLRDLGGEKEQMAGIAFRIQDAENFYVVRLSVLGQNLRFYKVVEGMRRALIGPSMQLETNVWYELKIQCEGNRILCYLDGQLVMPPLQDTSFTQGKIGFWTKSDSVCQFDGVRVTYRPLVALSTQIVNEALEAYARVVDLRLYTLADQANSPTVVACKNPEDLGQTGGKAETRAIRQEEIFFGKDKKTVTVVMPVRDRNGDPIAAARIVMDKFPGQTENNAIVRATPIVQLMEKSLSTSREEFR